MRILCNRKELLAGVELVLRACGKMPKLQHIKFVAADRKLVLSATDLEFGVKMTVGVLDVVQDGAMTVNGKDVRGILKGLTDEDVYLRTDADGLTIAGEVASFHLPVGDADDFPDVPEFKAEEYHEIGAEKLREVVEMTTFAAAKESTKFAMTGVRMEWNGKLVGVATDSKRLAVMDAETTKVGTPKDSEGLVPVKAAEAVRAACKLVGDDGVVRVAVGWRMNADTKAEETVETWFAVGNVVVYSRLVEGRYPPWREVFPKRNMTEVELPVAGLLAGLKSVSMACDDESRRVVFGFGGGRLTLTAQSPTRGKSETAMAVGYDGEPMSINFDPAHVVQMCQKMDKKDVVTFGMTEANRPGVFGKGKFKYLVMPLS